MPLPLRKYSQLCSSGYPGTPLLTFGSTGCLQSLAASKQTSDCKTPPYTLFLIAVYYPTLLIHLIRIFKCVCCYEVGVCDVMAGTSGVTWS